MTIHVAAPARPRSVSPQSYRGGTRYYIFGEAWNGDLTPLAYADTESEAEQAKRAFENVLAPRFTRDEAIAIVKSLPLGRALNHEGIGECNFCGARSLDWGGTATSAQLCPALVAGARRTLEALAAAGLFSDEQATVWGREQARTRMSDKLDAAEIR